MEVADGCMNRLVRAVALVIAALAGALLLGGGAGAQDASPAGSILNGLKRAGDGWEDGDILDPNKGKVYRAKAKLLDGGSRMEVRGFVGISLFGRTQTWIREK